MRKPVITIPQHACITDFCKHFSQNLSTVPLGNQSFFQCEGTNLRGLSVLQRVLVILQLRNEEMSTFFPPSFVGTLFPHLEKREEEKNPIVKQSWKRKLVPHLYLSLAFTRDTFLHMLEKGEGHTANCSWVTELFQITKILIVVFQMASLYKFVEMLFLVLFYFCFSLPQKKHRKSSKEYNRKPCQKNEESFKRQEKSVMIFG